VLAYEGSHFVPLVYHLKTNHLEGPVPLGTPAEAWPFLPLSCVNYRSGAAVVEALPILFDVSTKPIVTQTYARDPVEALRDFLPVERDAVTGEVGLRMDLNRLCQAAHERTGGQGEDAGVSSDVIEMVKVWLQEIRATALAHTSPQAPSPPPPSEIDAGVHQHDAGRQGASGPNQSRPAAMAQRTGEKGPHSVLLDTLLRAQDHNNQHSNSLAELRSGARTSHWIWWEWPAFSPVRATSQPEFDLPSCAAAQAWLSHPVLGERWLEITQAAVEQLERGVGAEQLLGDRDAVHKFLENVTLASAVARNEAQKQLASRAITVLERSGQLRPHAGVLAACKAGESAGCKSLPAFLLFSSVLMF
jgi:uncharacterized protein (DUF1810 family)